MLLTDTETKDGLPMQFLDRLNICSSEMDLQSGRYDAALRENLLQDVTLSEPATPHQDDGSTAKIGTELKSLARLSAPVIVQLTAQYAISVVNQLFIGHLGARPLAAAAIGNTVRPTAQHAVVYRFDLFVRHTAPDMSIVPLHRSGSISAGIFCWESLRPWTPSAVKHMAKGTPTPS